MEFSPALPVVLGFFFFVAFDAGPRRLLYLELSEAEVHTPEIRARLGSTSLPGPKC